MELDDINSVKPIGDHETSFYENTEISSATLEKTENSQPKQTENVERLYETLTLERKSNERKTLTLLEKDTIKRIKCFIYVILALVIALYIGIIALTIVTAVPKAQDGGWSSWETWGTCSDSCGGGIKSRNRSCSNPSPSLYGKQCIGNSEQVSLCNKQLCRETDGGWSNWENWSACTESCGGGIKSQNRSCSNPAPSMLGKQCLGNSEQISQCNKQLCPGTEHSVAFTAYNIYRNSSTNSILLFQNTHINIGDGYDTTTGKFTCPISGVYHFVVTLTKLYKDINYIVAYLRINGRSKLYLRLNPDDDDSNEVGTYMMTGAGTFHLNQNDVVDVSGVPDYFVSGAYSYFTGFLITPDQ